MKQREDTDTQGSSKWKLLVPDSMLTVILGLPLFVAVMWYGIRNGYEDLGLFALAVGLSVWGLCGTIVFTFRKIQESREQKRRRSTRHSA